MGQTFPTRSGHPSDPPPFMPKFEKFTDANHRSNVAQGVIGRDRLGASGKQASIVPHGMMDMYQLAPPDEDPGEVFGVHNARIKSAESVVLHGFKQVILEVNDRLQYSVKTLQSVTQLAEKLEDLMKRPFAGVIIKAESKQERAEHVRKLVILLLQIYGEQVNTLLEQYVLLDSMYGIAEEDHSSAEEHKAPESLSASTQKQSQARHSSQNFCKRIFQSVPIEPWAKLSEISEWIQKQLAQVGWQISPTLRPILGLQQLLNPPEQTSGPLRHRAEADNISKLWDQVMWNLSLPNFMSKLKPEVNSGIRTHIANLRSHLMHTASSVQATQVLCYSTLQCMRMDMRTIRRYSLDNPSRYKVSAPKDRKLPPGGEDREESWSTSSEDTTRLPLPEAPPTPSSPVDRPTQSKRGGSAIDFEFEWPKLQTSLNVADDDQPREYVPSVDFGDEKDSSESLDFHDEARLKALSRLPTLDEEEEARVLAKVSDLNRRNLGIASACAAVLLKPSDSEKTRETPIQPHFEELQDGTKRRRKKLDFLWKELRISLENGIDEMCRMERRIVQWKTPRHLLYIAAAYDLANVTQDPKEFAPPPIEEWPRTSRLASPLIHEHLIAYLVIIDSNFKKMKACSGLLTEDLFAMCSDSDSEQIIRAYVSNNHIWHLVGGELPSDPTQAFLQIMRSITDHIYSMSNHLPAIYQTIVHLLDTGDLPTPLHFVHQTGILTQCINQEAHRLNGINQRLNADYSAFESVLLSGFSPHIPPEKLGEYLEFRQSLKLLKIPTLDQRKLQEDAEELRRQSEWRKNDFYGSMSSEEDDEEDLEIRERDTREEDSDSVETPIVAESSSSIHYSGSTKVEGSWAPVEVSSVKGARGGRGIMTESESMPRSKSRPSTSRRATNDETRDIKSDLSQYLSASESRNSTERGSRKPPESSRHVSPPTDLPAAAYDYKGGESTAKQDPNRDRDAMFLSALTASGLHQPSDPESTRSASPSAESSSKLSKKAEKKAKSEAKKAHKAQKQKDKQEKKAEKARRKSQIRSSKTGGGKGGASGTFAITSIDSNTYFNPRPNSPSPTSQASSSSPLIAVESSMGVGVGGGGSLGGGSKSTTATPTSPTMTGSTASASTSNRRSSKKDAFYPDDTSSSESSSSTAVEDVEEDLPGEVGSSNPRFPSVTSRTPSGRLIYRQSSYSVPPTSRPTESTYPTFSPIRRQSAADATATVPGLRSSPAFRHSSASLLNTNPSSSFARMSAGSTAEATAMAHSMPGLFAVPSTVEEVDFSNVRYAEPRPAPSDSVGVPDPPSLPPRQLHHTGTPSKRSHTTKGENKVSVTPSTPKSKRGLLGRLSTSRPKTDSPKKDKESGKESIQSSDSKETKND